MHRSASGVALVAAIAVIAVIGGLGRPWSGPAEILILNAFFVGTFAASAWLFRRAARE